MSQRERLVRDGILRIDAETMTVRLERVKVGECEG